MGCDRLRKLFARNREMDKITTRRTCSYLVTAQPIEALQQIANKPTTNFFVKAPLRGAFTKKLGLVCSQSAVGRLKDEADY